MSKKLQALYRYVNHLAETGPNHYAHKYVAGLALYQLDVVKAEADKKAAKAAAGEV